MCEPHAKLIRAKEIKMPPKMLHDGFLTSDVAVLTAHKPQGGDKTASLPANFMENLEGQTASVMCFSRMFSGAAQPKTHKQ